MRRFIKILSLFKLKLKIVFFKYISDHKINCIINQPSLVIGAGEISIDKSVQLGVYRSPFFYSTYIYIDARKEKSNIKIEKNCVINNNATIISNGGLVHIKKNVLIGVNFEVIDSDFHNIVKSDVRNGECINKDVVIDEGVFIGNNVKILKGVKIGYNSIIGNGSVVTKSVPENTIVAGNPAKIIRTL